VIDVHSEEEEEEEKEEEEEEDEDKDDEAEEEEEEDDDEEVEVEEKEENDCWKNANAFLAKEVRPKVSSLDSLEVREDERPEALATPEVVFFFPPPELKRTDVPTPLPLSLPSTPTEPLRKRLKAPEIESVIFLTIECLLLFPPFPGPAALLETPVPLPPFPLLARRACFSLASTSI